MVVTNALGVAFAAALLSASDAGATFVFPEDGATNTLAWAQLAPASQAAVSAAAAFEPLPPGLAAAFRRARHELRRTAALEADGRLDAAAASRRRAGIRTAFARRCRRDGAAEASVAAWLNRL